MRVSQNQTRYATCHRQTTWGRRGTTWGRQTTWGRHQTTTWG
jgi:hypothetical protein